MTSSAEGKISMEHFEQVLADMSDGIGAKDEERPLLEGFLRKQCCRMLDEQLAWTQQKVSERLRAAAAKQERQLLSARRAFELKEKQCLATLQELQLQHQVQQLRAVHLLVALLDQESLCHLAHVVFLHWASAMQASRSQKEAEFVKSGKKPYQTFDKIEADNADNTCSSPKRAVSLQQVRMLPTPQRRKLPGDSFVPVEKDKMGTKANAPSPAAASATTTAEREEMKSASLMATAAAVEIPRPPKPPLLPVGQCHARHGHCDHRGHASPPQGCSSMQRETPAGSSSASWQPSHSLPYGFARSSGSLQVAPHVRAPVQAVHLATPSPLRLARTQQASCTVLPGSATPLLPCYANVQTPRAARVIRSISSRHVPATASHYVVWPNTFMQARASLGAWVGRQEVRKIIHVPAGQTRATVTSL